jgi:hypothetical protein
MFLRFVPLVAAGMGFLATLMLSASQQGPPQKSASLPNPVAPVTAPPFFAPQPAAGSGRALSTPKIPDPAVATTQAGAPEDSLPMTPDGVTAPPELEARDRDRDTVRSARSR